MATSDQSEMHTAFISFDGAEDVPDLATEIQQLGAFEELAPNWNSYGAKPISHAAVEAALRILTHIVTTFDAHPDFMAPVANGGVQLEWNGTHAELEVRANPDRTFSFLYTEGDDSTEERHVPMGAVLPFVAKTLAN